MPFKETKQRASLWMGGLNVIIATLALLGWHFDADLPKRVGPTMVAMNPLTASCLILCGLALLLHYFKSLRIASFVGALVATAAIIKLADLFVGRIPIDQFLYPSLLDNEPGAFVNRMAPNTALSLLFLGTSIGLLTSGRRVAHVAAEALSLVVLLISFSALVGYILGVEQLARVGPAIPMALQTALCLVAAGIGVLTLTRDTPLMLVLGDAGPAGRLARGVLPFAVLIPIAIGAAELWGQRLGLYDTPTGIEIMVLANVVMTSALLGKSTIALYRSDRLRKEREIALSHSEHLNRTINQASPDCVSLLDKHGRVLFSNDAAIRAYGLKSDDKLIGRPWGYLFDESAHAERDAALTAARSGGVGRLRLSMPGLAGELRWYESLVSRLSDADGYDFRYMVLSRDITVQKSIEERVRWSALHDPLTKLPNRVLFQNRLQETSQRASSPRFAVLLLDLDEFKLINDTLGHDAGDTLLCTVAERLQQSLGREDFVARLGGDEFGLILDGVASEGEAIAACDRIADVLREPWVYEGRMSDCRASVGASISVLQGNEPSELLKKADMALYFAKTQNRGRHAVFKTAMKLKRQKRSSERTMARDALHRDLIRPYYQPKVKLMSGRLAGFEALMRWRDPAGNMRNPQAVGAAFEDLELGREITNRILTFVLRDIREWLDEGLDFGHVAVNVSAADFKQRDFAEQLLARIKSHSIPASCLQVEVTETVFLGRGAEYVERALKTLSANGIRVALDDFGTGYASLSHLKQFPIDVVKIDRSFLRDVKDTHNAAIIATVVGLGRSLGLEVIAEGIETSEQAAHLISQGCHTGQGYFYARALPAARVPALVRSYSEGLHVSAA